MELSDADYDHKNHSLDSCQGVPQKIKKINVKLILLFLFDFNQIIINILITIFVVKLTLFDVMNNVPLTYTLKVSEYSFSDI